MQSLWTNLSSRVQLTMDRVACPPLLIHDLSDALVDALIPDHVLVPCDYFNTRAATLEVFFLSPIVPDAEEDGVTITPSTSNSGAIIEHLTPAMAIEHHFYSSKCKSSFDFTVTLEQSPSPQPQNRRRVMMPDFKWLLPHLKPEELEPSYWASSCKLSERISRYPTTVVGSNQWRAVIIASLQQWVTDSLVVKFHNAFVDGVTSICSRMSFEYNTCLCGVGDTAAAPFSVTESSQRVALRRPGDLPRELHQNRVIFSVREGTTATNSLFTVGMSIPLLLTEKANVNRKILVWIDLYLKLKRFRPLVRPLPIECSFTFFLLCDVVSTSFRVLKETFHPWLSLDESKPITFEAEGPNGTSPPPEMTCCSWWLDFLSDACDFSGIAWSADEAKRSASPSQAEATSGGGGTCPKGPRFGTPYSGSGSQTLMDFVPLLEDYLLDFCLREPGHFLELCNALTQPFGLPAELSPRVVLPSGQRAARSAMYHVLDETTELAVWVFVQYEGVMRMPSVLVGSFQVTLPSERPIKVKANVAPSGLKADPRGNFFDVVLMAEAIQAAVCQRIADIYSIVGFPREPAPEASAPEPPATEQLPSVPAQVPINNEVVSLPTVRHTDPSLGVLEIEEAEVVQEKSWFSPSPQGCRSPACVEEEEVGEEPVPAAVKRNNEEALPEEVDAVQAPTSSGDVLNDER